VFERNRFYSLFSGHPELAHSVTWIAATQETLLDNTIVSLGQRNAYQRIAHSFAQIYTRAETSGVVKDGLLEIPIRNHHISEALGITPVHVSRTLNKLKRESVIARVDGYFLISDFEKLAEVAAFDDHMPPTRPLL
jgi:CRP/FNR family transcriptional regulator